ncbi:hypothetical protein [Klebsiella michiganensis]|uniref:hypothetical protein n=1 Tax=Klebsiella michiganensis TaxID=1134687 RepID=UPI003DA16FDA
MTSKLTREFMQNIISGHGFGVAPSAVKAMAEYIVAAMDIEPVGYFGRFDPDDEDLIDQCSKNVKGAFPLYRHAQQPVVPDDVLDALQKVARIRLDMNDFDGDRRGIADCLDDAEVALMEVVNRCAAMLAAAPQEVKGE